MIDSSQTKMEISPPIYQLPNELLVKIIEKLPRTQWPALELVDRKFRDATLLAWGSMRKVDMGRDFIYSESMAVHNYDHDFLGVRERLRRQIAQKTEAILKKLSERSPHLTSLRGLTLMAAHNYPTFNSTAVRYLSEFEHLETIQFARKYFSGLIVDYTDYRVLCDISLINLMEFMESTRSRATLKEIDIAQCRVPPDDVNVAALFHRLRAALANVPTTRQLLQLESFSLRIDNGTYTFLDTIDSSRMTRLSLGYTSIEPAVLTQLIAAAPRLQHIDFAFLQSCRVYDNTTPCQNGRQRANIGLLGALESRRQLTSLCFNSIWYNGEYDCACHQFVVEFMKMLRTIGPQLTNFVFNPKFRPPDIRIGEIRDIIQQHMPNLKSLTLDSCCAAYTEELRGIADGKELEGIKIASVDSHADHRPHLDEVLSTIISASPRLKRFDGVHCFTDQLVAAELCKLSDLIDLRIRADRLTVENYAAFSQGLFVEKLQVLHLECTRIDVESGLIEFIGKAHQLRELVLDRSVTDRTLECVTESCPNLEKFCLWSPFAVCARITFAGVQLLVDRCPKLRWLGVRHNMVGASTSLLNHLKLDRYRKLELI